MMWQLSSSDVFTQLQPRHMCRRERKPGARERHSGQRQRHTHNTSSVNIPRISNPQSANTIQTSYCMDSAISEFSRNRSRKMNDNVEEEIITSCYKEVSTIEGIRANMKATSKPKSALPSHVPEWMMNLDINLDVTSIDIIPPFENNESAFKQTEAFTERPSLIFLENDSDTEFDEDENMVQDKSIKQNVNMDTERLGLMDMPEQSRENVQRSRPQSRQSVRALSSMDGTKPMSNTFKIAGRFSPTGKENESPRRYQGDKRVMSMQQGGIRSTPFQPKAKKFINQMITYRHMKHHDNKLKIAKPAVDTRMPPTFKIALERKLLVEQRLSDSWSRSYQTSTPTKSPNSTNSKSGNTPRRSTPRSR